MEWNGRRIEKKITFMTNYLSNAEESKQLKQKLEKYILLIISFFEALRNLVYAKVLHKALG